MDLDSIMRRARPITFGKVLGVCVGIIGLIGAVISVAESAYRGIGGVLIAAAVVGGSGLWIGYRSGYAANGAPRQGQALGVQSVDRRESRDRSSPLGERIRLASADIFFVGLNLYKLHTLQNQLRQLAARGVTVRFLLPDPREEWLITHIAEMLLPENPNFRGELAGSLKDFADLWRTFNSTVSVRVFRRLPVVTATMVDGAQADVDLIIPGIRREDRLVIDFDLTKATTIKNCLDSYWQQADPVETEQLFQTLIAACQ